MSIPVSVRIPFLLAVYPWRIHGVTQFLLGKNATPPTLRIIDGEKHSQRKAMREADRWVFGHFLGRKSCLSREKSSVFM